VTRFLDALAGAEASRVLISSEAFINLLTPATLPRFIEFIARCTRHHRIRIVLACRRIDSFMESMYLHSSKVGDMAVSVDDYIERRHYWALNLFARLSALRNFGLVNSLVFVKYQPSERYAAALLGALEIAPAEQQALSLTERVGQRLGAKAQAVLHYLDRYSEMIGCQINRARLVAAFEASKFSFEDEIYDYSVFAKYQRLFFHENALRACWQHGISEYLQFFQHDRLDERRFVRLEPDLLTRLDVEALSGFCLANAALTV
jgi:hypothetical protein